MLTIYKPEDDQDRKRRRWHALGYILAGVLIVAAEFVAYSSPWWYLPVAVEAWWMWAVISLDWENRGSS